VGRLLEAVALMEGAPRPVLVMPGYATSRDTAIRDLVEQLGLIDQVRFPGWVDDTTLDGLYRACDCFVLPSLAEGFGLPLVEAMSRGAPVACSDRSSLPEIAGGAALMFDPFDPGAIADAVTRVLADEALRERLVAAGRERARAFSWDAAARGTLAAYRRLLAEA
jgi:glycosyltransferase involved in cell wall biosynthesis